MSHDPVFDLIAANRPVPSGWGFPRAPGQSYPEREETSAATALRGILLPLEDEEGLAQLYRWHHSLLRSRQFIWRGLGGGRGNYDPSAVYKAVLAIPGERVTADHQTGFLTVEWIHAGETSALGGTLKKTGPSKMLLTLGGFEEEVPVSFEGDLAAVRWPEFMRTSAGLHLTPEEFTDGWGRQVAVRVAGFDPAYMVAEIERAGLVNGFLDKGLLDSWVALPDPVDRIALSWLLVSYSGVNQQIS